MTTAGIESTHSMEQMPVDETVYLIRLLARATRDVLYRKRKIKRS